MLFYSSHHPLSGLAQQIHRVGHRYMGDDMGRIHNLQPPLQQPLLLTLGYQAVKQAPEPFLSQAPPKDYRGTESVLVADDLAEQRQVASRILSYLGYDVQTVSDGRAAVEWLKTHAADLIVLDMIMEEGFDGLDTYREIVRVRPGQRAIIASGFSETDRVREAQKLGAGEFIRKPYTIENIGRAIRRELDREGD